MPAHPWMMRAEKEIIIIWGVSQIQRFLRLILNGAFQESGVGLPGRMMVVCPRRALTTSSPQFICRVCEHPVDCRVFAFPFHEYGFVVGHIVILRQNTLHFLAPHCRS